jgi:hypothetical protein
VKQCSATSLLLEVHGFRLRLSLIASKWIAGQIPGGIRYPGSQSSAVRGSFER